MRDLHGKIIPASVWLPILLLILAPLVWVTGCGGEQRGEPDPADFSDPDLAGSDLVLAEVAGEPITAGFLKHKIRIQHPGMPQAGPSLARQMQQLLPQVIMVRCFTKLAEDRGYDRDPEFLRALHLSRAFILKNVTYNNAIVKPVEPTEEDIQRYYEEHQERFVVKPQVWYHHILLDSEAEAWSVRKRVMAGEDFEDLAKKLSRDQVSGKRGGRMPAMTPRFMAGQLGKLPELGEAVMQMEAEEISEPIRTEKGWHIVRADASRKRMMRPLDDVRDDIVTKVSSGLKSKLYEVLLDSLNQAYQVQINKDALDRFYMLQLDDAQLFAEAQKEEDPLKKLSFYEQILERYPESEHGPNALFMVGFIRAEETGDSLQALEAFQSFLAKYPDHEMSSSAGVMIKELQGEDAEDRNGSSGTQR